MKNNTLTNKNGAKMRRVCMVAILMAFMMTFATFTGVIPTVLAGGALDGIMDTIIGIISDAALYIGIVIVLWGVFQIVLAFRREDSEGISKQITTVVVGGVLVGFGAIAEGLYDQLASGG